MTNTAPAANPFTLIGYDMDPELLELIQRVDDVADLIDSYRPEPDGRWLDDGEDVKTLLERLEDVRKGLRRWETLGDGGTPLEAARGCSFIAALLASVESPLAHAASLDQANAPTATVEIALARAAAAFRQLARHRAMIANAAEGLRRIGQTAQANLHNPTEALEWWGDFLRAPDAPAEARPHPSSAKQEIAMPIPLTNIQPDDSDEPPMAAAYQLSQEVASGVLALIERYPCNDQARWAYSFDEVRCLRHELEWRKKRLTHTMMLLLPTHRPAAKRLEVVLGTAIQTLSIGIIPFGVTLSDAEAECVRRALSDLSSERNRIRQLVCDLAEEHVRQGKPDNPATADGVLAPSVFDDPGLAPLVRPDAMRDQRPAADFGDSIRECECGTAPPKSKGKDINSQILIMLSDDLERYSWSARQWAEALGCSAGTVKETKSWAQIRAYRGATAAERISPSGLLAGGRKRRR